MVNVHHALAVIPAHLTRVALLADRHTVAKKRWRGVAADGKEFNFALEEPLVHGAVFYASKTSFYVLLQEPERIVEIPLHGAAATARIAWLMGGHHFALEIKNGSIRVTDSAAVRRLLAREHISFKERKAVFHPFRTRD